MAAGQGNLADRGDGVRVVIDLSRLANAGTADGTVVFPQAGAVVTTSFASVSFPPGVVATAAPADGLLALHVVAAADGPPSNSSIQDLAYDGSGTVVLQGLVEIGDANGRIAFDKPVRISLEGQAGGRAFYAAGANGSIKAIDAACAADDTERVHRQLGGAGECRLDSGGDLVVHTYHLTRFGTVASERGTPPPVLHTCSLRLGHADLAVPVQPGGYSDAAEQAVANSGSQPFARVDLAATPWSVDPAPGAQGPNAAPSSLPANRTAMSTAGPDEGFAPLPAAGAAVVAHGLGGGLESPLWFVLDLTGHALAPGTKLVQDIAYTAECVGPPGQ